MTTDRNISMVKALRIESENVTRFAEIPEAPLLPGHVRISVRHVGLCGSDLNTFKGLNPLVELPRIPGHEMLPTPRASALSSCLTPIAAPARRAEKAD